MADDAAALDDLLASPAPMGDDEPEDIDVDEEPDDEFGMHADVVLDDTADPEERKDALRMAILALVRGS